jgi:xylulokinase
VIYGVSDALTYDPGSRVNSFAHVNYSAALRRVGVLLCINGTGILNRWVRDLTKGDYDELNAAAARLEPGAAGLKVWPFGNGAERIFYNKIPGAQMQGIDLNVHGAAHVYRAGQEGIAFAFRYGLDIMRENGMNPGVIRAGKANMFRSAVFTEAFVNATNVPVELYNSDGSIGAAIGAGIGAGIYKDGREAFAGLRPVELVEPKRAGIYDVLYHEWKQYLPK